MCEKKNKKLLVCLFLVPLISLASLFVPLSANAVTAPTGDSGSCNNLAPVFYTTTANMSSITSVLVGDDGNGGSCTAAGETFKPVSGQYLSTAANGTCAKNNLAITSSLPTSQDEYNKAKSFSGTYTEYDQQGSGCTRHTSDVTVYKSKTEAVSSTTTTTSTSGSDGKTSCAVQGVGWLVCPVMNFASGIADVAFGFLSDSFLSINTQLYDTNSGTYSAWQGILGFANIIFVIIFLIIIFAQATGFGISNYGIKKMLPKLIIGVILINISYFICQAAVDVSNITGYGFNKFFDNITTNVVVSNAPTTDADTNGLNVQSWQYITGIVLTAGAGVGVAYLLGLSVLIPVLFVVVVTLLFIFLVLILRQALIVVLIIAAPLAFAAWLLPNTEKFFKQWWGLFSKMLLIFPIIAVVFGASKLASAILRDAYTNINPVNGVGSDNVATNNSEMIGQIIAAGILVIPLIAVPLILRGALNAVPVIGNMMQKAYNNNANRARQMGANTGLAQYDKQRKANRNARVASGNYRGAGGVLNPFNVGSAANRRINKSRAFNLATVGYGAQRDLAAQRQSEKDRKDAVDMFNNNEGLMQAWAKDGGRRGKEYSKLDANSKQQYDRMMAVGHHRRSTSYLAVADYMSQNGKGDFDTYRNALIAARASGADEAELSDTQAGSLAAYRGSGRGDIVGQIRAHEKANAKRVEQRDADGNVTHKTVSGTLFDDKNASRDLKLAEMQKAWSETGAGKVHRDGIKIDRDDDGQVIIDPVTRMAAQPSKNRGTPQEDLGMLSYQFHLTATNTKTLVDDNGHAVLDSRGQRQIVAGDGQNISTALEKFNDMEQRAQNQVKDTLIGAAEDFRLQQLAQAERNGIEAEEKFQNRIVNINQAKDMFGMLPGGRFTAAGQQQPQQQNPQQPTGRQRDPRNFPQAPRPPESNEERLRREYNFNNQPTGGTPDSSIPDIDASDDDYDASAD